jgi:hypothetical protein
MADHVIGISTAIDIAKRLKKSADTIKDSEMKLLIADLMGQLAEAKTKCAGLVEENTKLKKSLEAIYAQRLVGVTLVGDVYMSGSDGPFCKTCWDSNSRKLRLKEEIKDSQGVSGHKYACPICRSRYKGENG